MTELELIRAYGAQVREIDRQLRDAGYIVPRHSGELELAPQGDSQDDAHTSDAGSVSDSQDTGP